jgi:uncharacterized protein (DUF3084 family)
MESGAFLIPILIVVSGVVAYIGNLVGRAVGRRRLSVFGLRPRYTATLITIITGMLITLISITSVLVFSQNARTALFELNVLREQIRSAESRLRELRGRDIAYLREEEVLREVIDGRLVATEILTRLDAMRLRAVDRAVSKGIAPDLVTGGVLSLYPPNLTWEAIAQTIAQKRADVIVRIVAQENTLQGEALRVSVLTPVRRLVYARGRVLLSATVDGRAGRERVGRELLGLADEVADRAKNILLSPPLARTTEPPRAQVDVDDHRAAITAIVARNQAVRVDIIVGRDLMTDSPLVVRFVVAR